MLRSASFKALLHVPEIIVQWVVWVVEDGTDFVHRPLF